MKRFIPIPVFLVLFSCAAIAGPNQGVVLAVHGAQSSLDTCGGDICYLMEQQLPETCEEFVPTADPDACFGAEIFLVLVASPPANDVNFSTVVFGLGDYDDSENYIGYFGPCRTDLAPLEIPSDGWPGPNSGTAVSWAPNCFTRTLQPVYWFAVYSYGPGQVPLGNFYPGQQALVVSCDFEEDVFADYAVMGCGGAEGSPACPEMPTPAESTTWGRIKSIYR